MPIWGGAWAGVWLAALVATRAQQPSDTPAHTASSNAPPSQLTLADAQRMAFERNWDLLAAAAGVEAATAQKIVARQFQNPTLSQYTSLINVDNHPNSTVMGNGLWERSYDTIFAINQLFEIGGKRRNRKASAQAGFEGAKAQLFDARRTLDLAVAKAYVAAAQAEENVRVLRQSASTLR
jgi:outer membrane protein TolC